MREELCSRMAALRGEVEFEIVLSIRNPIDMAGSAYHQAVKRNGETRPFEECATSECHLLAAEKWHRDLVDLGIKTRLINYSKARRTIIRTFLEALECAPLLQEHMDAEAERRIVNRSLSLMELNLVRVANREFGPHVGQMLSDQLVETSPNIKSHMERVPDELIAYFEARFGPAITYFNSFLPQADQLEITDTGCGAEELVPGNADEEYSSIAAAFNSAWSERDALARDANARRSRLAHKLDYWDYRIHRTLGELRLFGKEFQERFKAAAEHRHRNCYNK